MGFALITGHMYTYGDYLAWDDEERWELIEGVPYNMTPAPSRFHQEILVNLSWIFRSFLEDKPCRVYFAPFDVRLPEKYERDEDVTTVVQPDLVVVCDLKKLDDRGCRGAPDLIIEVLSPSTAARDHIQKLALYEKHGVREYWLVHPVDRIATVYYLLEETGRYGKPRVFATDDTVEVAVLPGLAIVLGRVFGDRKPD